MKFESITNRFTEEDRIELEISDSLDIVGITVMGVLSTLITKGCWSHAHKLFDNLFKHNREELELYLGSYSGYGFKDLDTMLLNRQTKEKDNEVN